MPTLTELLGSVLTNVTQKRQQNRKTGSKQPFGKGIVKTVSSMIKMSNFLAKNVIMTALTQGFLNA